MQNKQFYHFFANGKKYDLLEDGKFIYFKRESCYKDTATYQFVYHIFDSQFTDSRNSIFVSFRLKFEPLKYYSYETRKQVGRITAQEIMRVHDSPHAILSKMKSISNYYFSCEKVVLCKDSLVKKMESDLNSHWSSSTPSYEFYISYEELYNL